MSEAVKLRGNYISLMADRSGEGNLLIMTRNMQQLHCVGVLTCLLFQSMFLNSLHVRVSGSEDS